MSAGFVYVLANPALRDRNGAPIFKIGGTARTPLRRAAELSASSSLPERFSVAFEARCQDWKALECAVHLSLHRFRLRGEFFSAPLETIAAAIHQALAYLEPDDGTAEQSTCPDPSSPSTMPAMPSFIDLEFGTATKARIYCPGEMVSFSSRYGTIDADLPPVPRRLRADRARRVRDYIQQSMAERLFREIRPVLEPDVKVLPEAGPAECYGLTINGAAAFQITIGARRRWLSRRPVVLATARSMPGFCGDQLLPSEVTRTGSVTEREAVLKEVVEGAVRAFVQHALAKLESHPHFLQRN